MCLLPVAIVYWFDCCLACSDFGVYLVVWALIVHVLGFQFVFSGSVYWRYLCVCILIAWWLTELL